MNDRTEHLFELIGQVDSALIDEAARPLPVFYPQRRWPKRAALCAACLLLAVGLWRIGPGWPAAGSVDSTEGSPGENTSHSASGGSDGAAPGDPGELPSEAGDDSSTGEGAPPEHVDGLPILSVFGQLAEGGGSLGLWVAADQDPRQAVQDYLSDAITLPEGTDILPVYRSTVEQYASSTPVDPDEAAMEALLDDVLARLGLTQADCEVIRTTSEGGDASGQENIALVSLEAVAADGTTVTVHYDLTYRICLPPEALPQGFPQSADTATQEGALAQGQAIIRLLGALLDMDEPVCHLTGGGVDIDGAPEGYYITISEDGDPLSSPSRPTVSTWGWDGGDMGLWLDFDPKLTQELVGEYPIVSMDQAREEILAGEWSPDGTVPAQEDIYRAELVYCTDLSGLTMPYYCFYLYKGTFDGGMHEIECRYVPAVARQYLDLSSCSGLLGDA